MTEEGIEETVEETYDSTITFVDTNVIIPQSAWEFYRNNLCKHKKEGFLAENTQIIEGDLREVIVDSQKTLDVLKKQENLNLTRGVKTQVCSKINGILENITLRREKFIFVGFNYSLNDRVREKSDRIYGKLMDYSKILEDTLEFIKGSLYNVPTDEIYHYLTAFVFTLRHFFESSKIDHNLDFVADEFFVVACLYESLINNELTKVVSNDGDIANLLGLCCYIFEELKPATKNNPNFKYFCEHLPTFYNLFDPSGELIEVDLINRGSIVCDNKFKIKTRISGADAKEYNSMVHDFTLFLDRSVDQLISLVTR